MPAILIVDDDSVDRELVSRCLASIPDLVTRFATDGPEAIESLRQFEPDLVLTDLRMPRMDGLELVERVKEEHPLVPVVLMTAKGSEQIAVQALQAGAASYVPKDDLKQDLVETVIQVLLVQESRRSKVKVLKFLRDAETKFELENDPGLISPAVGYFQENLERLNFGTEACRTHVGIALMEALSNAMIHGNLDVTAELRRSNRDMYDRLIARRRKESPYAERVVRLEAREGTDAVEYVISDEGQGFDVADIPDRTLPENMLGVGGRGIMLMYTFMDEVRYNKQGNNVTLIKKLPAESRSARSNGRTD